MPARVIASSSGSAFDLNPLRPFARCRLGFPKSSPLRVAEEECKFASSEQFSIILGMPRYTLSRKGDSRKRNLKNDA